MYAVTVQFTLKSGQQEAFLPLMVENARTSLLEESGCLQFDVLRGGAADVVFLYEIYEDRAAFDLHLQSAHFKSFDAAVGDMVADKIIQTFDEVIR